VKAAGAMVALGMDGMALLRTSDPVDALVLQAVAEESVKVLQQRDRALAAEIANAVGRLFK
jgi:hypothetical protein